MFNIEYIGSSVSEDARVAILNFALVMQNTVTGTNNDLEFLSFEITNSGSEHLCTVEAGNDCGLSYGDIEGWHSGVINHWNKVSGDVNSWDGFVGAKISAWRPKLEYVNQVCMARSEEDVEEISQQWVLQSMTAPLVSGVLPSSEGKRKKKSITTIRPNRLAYIGDGIRYLFKHHPIVSWLFVACVAAYQISAVWILLILLIGAL